MPSPLLSPQKVFKPTVTQTGVCLFYFERERGRACVHMCTHMSRREEQRGEREGERIPSRLHTQEGARPRDRFQDPGIMT